MSAPSRSPTPKIDLHAHVIPDRWPNLKERYGYGGWLEIKHEGDKSAVLSYDDGRFFRRIESNCWNVQDRIADMDRTGVTVQVLSTTPVLFGYSAKPDDALDFSRLQNDFVASMVSQRPDRFVGLCTVPMQSPQLASEELKRCVTQLGMRGVIIGSHVNELTLADRALDPFYKLRRVLLLDVLASIGVVARTSLRASARKSSSLVAVWLYGRYFCCRCKLALQERAGQRMARVPKYVGMPAETTAAICEVIFGGLLERFRRLKLCFAHGAGSFPYTVGRIQHGFDVRPDLCAVDNKIPPKSYLGEIYADSLVHSRGSLRILLDVLGQDRVMLGSDYPYPLGEIERPGRLIERSGLEDSLKEMLLWKNAASFLGIEMTPKGVVSRT
ncbi:hypothetical protein HPB50_017819 [Hyalomma asiaticum]|uniref:Uncharacterized protein n=2 Tax=Hyalomma asiaticum TaxID=266040 RepID=A0ACB7SWU2_HYAAI|nr:hypothetical protein HPB50_017819 [Hyalomma asiaticum]